MKATIATPSLVEGLNLASVAAAQRTPQLSLQSVLIKAQKDGITLMATDLEVGIRYQIAQVKVQETGEVLVPVGKLLQIVRESVDETTTLETEGNTLHIRGKDSHFRIYSGDPREFPPVSGLDGPADFEASAEKLRQVINRTLFAAAKESTRYAIDGLLWERKGSKLKVVATDGRRLAVAGCTVEKPTGNDGKVIVPFKTMSLVGKVLSDPQETFQVKFLSNQILFQTSRVTISSVLVEGHFPKYEDVIPQDSNKKITASVSEMLSAVRRAALLTSEDSKGIRLNFGEKKVLLTGRVPEQGESSVELPLRAYEGESLEIGFNPTFLSDVLRAVDTEEVEFELKDASRPALFRQKDSEYVYVVMPVNLT